MLAALPHDALATGAGGEAPAGAHAHETLVDAKSVRQSPIDASMNLRTTTLVFSMNTHAHAHTLTQSYIELCQSD
jgi:hypothetical protein